MLLTVTEVMVQVVASIFEDIIALIFGLPAGPTRRNNRFNRIFINMIIGDKGIEIQLLAGIFTSEGQFTPVDVKSILPSP